VKTFYTERDIELMAKLGLKVIEIGDDDILTDLAREKVEALGLRVERVVGTRDVSQAQPPLPVAAPRAAAAGQPVIPPSAPAPSAASPPAQPTAPPQEELARLVKEAVIARLGPGVSETLIDQAISKALAEVASQ
jgi:hypothetical protein